MAQQGWNGRVAVDIRDSEPDWTPFLQPTAPEGAPTRGRWARPNRDGRDSIGRISGTWAGLDQTPTDCS